MWFWNNRNRRNNVATGLLYSQNVNQVIAPDGRNLKVSDDAVYAFYNNNDDSYDIKRPGRGYTLYQMINGRIVITPYLSLDNERIGFDIIINRGLEYADINRSISLPGKNDIMLIYGTLLAGSAYARSL